MPGADVTPIDRSGLSTAPLDDPDAQRIREVLLGTNRYDLTVWWRQHGADLLRNRRSLDIELIRPAAAVALGLAASIATGAYDPGRAGRSLDVAHDRAVFLVAILARGHVAVRDDGEGWGRGWQTALWAAYAGLAAWLLWEDLQPVTRNAVATMVADEADAFIDYEVPYLRDASGAVLTPGDTKAEENSWNARLVHLATVMMPGHPRAGAWARSMIPLLLSAYARPRDAADERIIHGRPLSRWLSGSNAEPDGVLVNHNRIHPDYMVVPHHAAVLLHSLLARGPAPEAAVWNLDVVYSALVDVTFSSPPYAEPGGTIYVDGSSEIYYPQGSSWGRRRRINFMLQDVQARAFRFDSLASEPAATWERLHTAEVLEMMARFDDGRVYSSDEEFRSPQREEEAAERAGQAYLTKWLVAQRPFDVTSQPVH